MKSGCREPPFSEKNVGEYDIEVFYRVVANEGRAENYVLEVESDTVAGRIDHAQIDLYGTPVTNMTTTERRTPRSS